MVRSTDSQFGGARFKSSVLGSIPGETDSLSMDMISNVQ